MATNLLIQAKSAVSCVPTCIRVYCIIYAHLTLHPDQCGAKQLLAQYGNRLVTVEVVVEESDGTTDKLSGINEDFVKKGADQITDEDIKQVTDRADEIKKQFSCGGPLGRFVADLSLLLSIVRDYWNGSYRKGPYWAIAAIVFALLYVLNPIDIIPDVIPAIGYLDDAMVVAVCLAMVEQQLHEYKEWKQGQP